MKEDDFRRWASRLRELDEAQVQNLYGRLQQLGKKPNGREKEQDDDWLLPGLIAALKDQGMLSSSAVPALKNSKQYKRYLEFAPLVRKRLSTLIKEGDTRSRSTLSYVVGKSLIMWCERKRLPESPGTVISMVCHSKEALELQFPGYISAGMFAMILKGLPHLEDIR